jgi:hypothetical protein
MPADTLTLTLLDREVVLTRNGGAELWFSDDGMVMVSRSKYGPMIARLMGVDIRGDAHSVESAVADLDQKLRQLREWLR